MNRGDFDYRSTSSAITVFKWKDRKAVHFISNYHAVEMESVQRKEKDGSKIPVSCPNVVKDYNETMSGFDKHDMLRRLYGVNRKSLKWWHRLFFGMLDMTIVNSYVLYKESNMESLPLLDFRRELALGLLTLGMNPNRPGPGAPKRRKSSFSVPMTVRLNNLGVHWPQFLPKKGRREVYSQNGIESRPYSICSHCGVHLCCNSSKMCFRVYHT